MAWKVRVEITNEICPYRLMSYEERWKCTYRMIHCRYFACVESLCPIKIEEVKNATADQTIPR